MAEEFIFRMYISIIFVITHSVLFNELFGLRAKPDGFVEH